MICCQACISSTLASPLPSVVMTSVGQVIFGMSPRISAHAMVFIKPTWVETAVRPMNLVHHSTLPAESCCRGDRPYSRGPTARPPAFRKQRRAQELSPPRQRGAALAFRLPSRCAHAPDGAPQRPARLCRRVDQTVEGPRVFPRHGRGRTETAHIRTHHAIAMRKLRNPPVPRSATLRVAVQHQNGAGIAPGVCKVVDQIVEVKVGWNAKCRHAAHLSGVRPWPGPETPGSGLMAEAHEDRRARLVAAGDPP